MSSWSIIQCSHVTVKISSPTFIGLACETAHIRYSCCFVSVCYLPQILLTCNFFKIPTWFLFNFFINIIMSLFYSILDDMRKTLDRSIFGKCLFESEGFTCLPLSPDVFFCHCKCQCSRYLLHFYILLGQVLVHNFRAGISTVDYVITSIPVRKYLTDFRVGEMSANSDHCPLQFSIEGSINSVRYLQSVSNFSVELLSDCFDRQDNLQDHGPEAKVSSYITYSLLDDSEAKVQEHINSSRFKAELNGLFSSIPNISPDESASQLSYILQDIMVKCSRIKPYNQGSYNSNNSFPANVWFDNECKKQKRTVNDLAKKLGVNPTSEIRSRFWIEKAKYKKLIKRKKRLAIMKFHSMLKSIRKCNPTHFWNIISSCTNPNTTKSIPVPPDKLFDHFKDLHNIPSQELSRAPFLTPPNMVQVDDMWTDSIISEDEVINAIRAMKSSKSPGPDGIPPKIFKVFNRPIITCIKLLFKLTRFWNLGNSQRSGGWVLYVRYIRKAVRKTQTIIEVLLF